MVRLMEELYRLKPKEALSLAGLVRISDHAGDQRRARRPCLPAARRAGPPDVIAYGELPRPSSGWARFCSDLHALKKRFDVDSGPYRGKLATR